uniref:Uncharacterized protein n=1 Tax=Anguilla anguilla TaxID=7936 RepID=A0A0E9VGB9_ANGAN
MQSTTIKPAKGARPSAGGGSGHR